LVQGLGEGLNREKFMQLLRTIAIAAALSGLAAHAHAETAEIKLARQFSMGYLQLNVMEHQQLIEKHAKALGLSDVKVSWFTFNGPAAVNDALISGNIDIASGGVPALLTLWAKTKGTPQEVRGITALSSQPFLLNSRNPDIKTLADFKSGDKIAVPAVKVSVQAITLQMAAAKTFGIKDFARLDELTVSMTPPDATIALMNGGSEITSAFSVPPFQYQQLENAAVHTVLNSFDVLGGSHSFTVAWTSAKFRDANPVLYKALIAAFSEATAIVNKDKPAAAALWIEDAKSKLPLDMVAKIVAGPQVQWTLTPENTMKFAGFMAEAGTLKTKPASWKDYFFPEIYELKGS
jgi:NitT/TauT family transport system substrate-binding protein